MNVTGDRLIAGGDNGCVGVWEISTCKLIASIPPHHSYDPDNHPGRGLAYNVAIWDNYAVYGTRNGIHVVYNLETKTIQNEFDILNIVNHRDEKKESDKEKKDIKIPRSLLETRNCSFPLQPPAILHPNSEFMILGKGIRDNGDSDEDQIEYEFNDNDDGTLEDLNLQEEEDINAPITISRAGAEDHEANMENRPIFHHADFNNFVALEEDMMSENYFQPLDSLIPRTLSMNSHVLITNAIPEIHFKNGNCIQNGRLSVWDYRKGKHLYYLNENVLHRDSKWLQNGNFLADISLAEISKDSSIIYASSILEDDTVDFDIAQEMKIRLSVWDFLGTGPNQKLYPGLKVEKRELKTPDGLMGYDVWVLSRED